MSQSNLFEQDPAFAPAQGSLFDGGLVGHEATRCYLPDPADIRRRLNEVLAKARCSERMPWNERDARMWQTVFPQMTNWLPEDEAKQLRFQFAEQIERLRTFTRPG